MQPELMLNQMLGFNKTVQEYTWEQINFLQRLTETRINICIDQTPCGPEAKKAAKELLAMCEKGYEDYRTLIDGNVRKMDTLFHRKQV